VREAAMIQAEARGLDGPLLWAAGEGSHPGVVGIVAARIKEATGRPTVVIGLDGDEGKGSGRSIAGIDLGHSVQRVSAEGLLIKGGGHRMAAGLTVARSQLGSAMARLSELLDKQGAGKLGPRDLRIDAPLMPQATTIDLAEEIERVGPFGQAAPAPRFAFPDVAILHAREVGSGHLKVSFGDGLGTRIDGIAFGAFDSDLGTALASGSGARFHLAGKLEINHWGGRKSVQLRIDDAAPV
ncbi:MAG: DHHA1 domain-containing protein, partial [Boseongicola sp.]|nr:DHHA1 domain-containing protein [Boseongicola sp.]